VELTDANRRTLYVPEGFAHGYLTLSSGAEVLYQVSEFYTPGSERGVGWDDPAFGIEWPIPVTVISDRDKQHPRFEV
jgi:dTDP-4-dehydrorhamnose 3,5-epimerase